MWEQHLNDAGLLRGSAWAYSGPVSFGSMLPMWEMTVGTVKSIGIWLRVSTEDQVRGESPEHHERRARAYAEAKGWHVAEVYRLDAIGGKAVMHHAEARRMLADVRAGLITGLVFSKLARLARNTKELLEFAEIFRECNADLVSLAEAIDTSTAAGRLFFTMIAAMAEWEREEIADRVRASVPIRAALGKPTGGAAPFGYQWVDRKLVPNPGEAPIRRLVHELFIEHRRRKTVARVLNDRGYRTRNGSRWSDTTVERLLRDPTAKGERRSNYTQTSDNAKSWQLKPESDWVWTQVEPIVDPELWDRCVAILEAQKQTDRKPAKKALHLFTGYTYCACGAPMRVRHRSTKYDCEACHNKIPIDDLEAVYCEQLSGFVISEDDLAAHRQSANELMNEKAQLVERAQTELRQNAADEDELFRLYRAEALATADFARRHRPLSERRAQLEAELPRLQAELDVLKVGAFSQEAALDEARDLLDRWPTMEAAERRQIVEAITERVVVGKDDVEINLIHIPSPSTPSGTDGIMAMKPHSRVALLLSGVKATLHATKPEIEAEQGESLGARLRRRRRALGLNLAEAARRLGACPKTLTWREQDARTPFPSMYPEIIKFLGYEPWSEPRTLAEALVAERRRRGLGVKEAAPTIGVDEGTWLRWERGEWKPTRLTLPQIDHFLGIDTKVRFPACVR